MGGGHSPGGRRHVCGAANQAGDNRHRNSECWANLRQPAPAMEPNNNGACLIHCAKMRNTLIIASLAFASGLWLGSRRPEPVAIVETPAPAVRQDDGSLVASRVAAVTALPVQVKLPAKSKPVRQVTATASAVDCQSVEVTTTIVEMPDLTYRAIVSSSNGEILTATDTPIGTRYVQPDYKWAAGVEWQAGTHRVKPWLDYDAGRVRVGAVVWGQGGKPAASLRLGWRW